MAVSQIEQEPKYNNLPVGQPIVFVISNNDAVTNQSNVKFTAKVFISAAGPPSLSNTNKLIGTFKTTPNDAGVGIFDFRSVVENYVSADNYSSDNAKVDGALPIPSNLLDKWPIHIIDKYSKSVDSCRFLKVQFGVEYLDTSVSPPFVQEDVTTLTNSDNFKIINGYLKPDDKIDEDNISFGYNLVLQFGLASSDSSFLSNMPTTLYSNLYDWGVFALYTPSGSAGSFTHIEFKFNWNDGTTSTETLDRNNGNGAYSSWALDASNHILYFGAFPANIQDWYANFTSQITAGKVKGGSIEIRAMQGAAVRSKTYTIHINCDEPKGYKPIRLCWLNQWGGWDYWTFTKKSVTSYSQTPTTWNSLQGSWNHSYYSPSYKGGKRNLTMNTKEKIQVNTDFIGEEYNVMFEEMLNSPEVYELTPKNPSTFTKTSTNYFVQPVILLNNTFIKKTRANDKLIQYSFEIEKSRTLKTQTI